MTEQGGDTAGVRVPGLQKILDIDGLRDDVLSFLHAQEVAKFACVSSKCRAAATKPSGKLRAVNLVVNFDSKASTNILAQRVTASPALELGHVYALVDVPLLETLLVHVKGRAKASAEEQKVEIGSLVLGQVQSLMGPALRTFGLVVTILPPAGENDDAQQADDYSWGWFYGEATVARKDANRFAESVLGLTQLRTLCIPSGLSTRSVTVRPEKRNKLPHLKKLHLTGDLDLERVCEDSLLFMTLGVGEGGEQIAASSGVTDFACCGFDKRSFSVLESIEHVPHPGAKLWKSLLTPSLRKLSFCEFKYWSREELTAATNVWAEGRTMFAGCEGVTHLELDILPSPRVVEMFPALKALYLNSVKYGKYDLLGDSQLRMYTLPLVEELVKKKILLYFRDFEVSGAELGILWHKLPSFPRTGSELEPHDEWDRVFRELGITLQEALEERLSKTHWLKTGPQLFPLFEQL